jgi:hypothetical protein
MAESVTLDLPDDVTRRAREDAQRSGREVEDVLVEWIQRGIAAMDGTWLMPGVDYPIWTPYGNEAAAEVLLEVLKTPEGQEVKTSRTN